MRLLLGGSDVDVLGHVLVFTLDVLGAVQSNRGNDPMPLNSAKFPGEQFRRCFRCLRPLCVALLLRLLASCPLVLRSCDLVFLLPLVGPTDCARWQVALVLPMS